MRQNHLIMRQNHLELVFYFFLFKNIRRFPWTGVIIRLFFERNFVKMIKFEHFFQTLSVNLCIIWGVSTILPKKTRILHLFFSDIIKQQKSVFGGGCMCVFHEKRRNEWIRVLIWFPSANEKKKKLAFYICFSVINRKSLFLEEALCPEKRRNEWLRVLIWFPSVNEKKKRILHLFFSDKQKKSVFGGDCVWRQTSEWMKASFPLISQCKWKKGNCHSRFVFHW